MREPQNSFKHTINKSIDYWYLYMILFPLSILTGYLYLQNTQPKYEASALLLIKNETEPGEEVVFTELGKDKKSKNLENEVLVLRSTPLMHEVVNKLGLQFQYTTTEGFKKLDLYKKSPVIVAEWIPIEAYAKPLEAIIKLGKSTNSFELEIEEKIFEGEFGLPLLLPFGQILLKKNELFPFQNPVQITFIEPWTTAQLYGSEFNVKVLGQTSSMLQLTLRDISPERAKDILGNLIEAYNQRTVADKKLIFENTISFIEERIKLIAGELSESEQEVENYKSKHNAIELSNEGNMLLADLNTYKKELSNTAVQLEVLNTIQAYLTKNREKFEFVPSNLNLTNLTLNKQLEDFNRLLVERARLRNEFGHAHPDVILNERQLFSLRETIINNIYSIKKDLEITNSANENLMASMENRLKILPKRERELFDKERKKNIKENLFTFLLQKREESGIALAATAATGREVEPPSVSEPVSPKPVQVWLIVSFLGLALPAILTLLLESLNDKIRAEEDIRLNTSVQLAGVLAKSKGREKLVTKKDNLGRPAEMFRMLRSNLVHLYPEKEFKTLLITSSMDKEGKSYIALNLGMTQVLTGRRVVIVDLDLRSKTQETYSEPAPAKIGLSDYLTNLAIAPHQVINMSKAHPCLDIINRGNLIPNPSQMVLSNRLRELVQYLRTQYDFIILDSPAVGMVADTLEMGDLAEATMYVVRSNFTKQKRLKIIEDIANKRKLPKPFIVLNAVSLKKIGKTVYRYDAGYEINVKTTSGLSHIYG